MLLPTTPIHSKPCQSSRRRPDRTMVALSLALSSEDSYKSSRRPRRRDVHNLHLLLRGLVFAMIASFLAGALALGAAMFIGREHAPRLKGLWGGSVYEELPFSYNVSSCPGASVRHSAPSCIASTMSARIDLRGAPSSHEARNFGPTYDSSWVPGTRAPCGLCDVHHEGLGSVERAPISI